MKKFIILMMAALAILAVSCANDMPSTGDTIEQIQVPEATGTLEGETLEAVKTITGAIKEDTEFTATGAPVYKAALYVEDKYCADVTLGSEMQNQTTTHTFIVSIGDFKVGDVLVETSGNNYEYTYKLNGKDITETEAQEKFNSLGESVNLRYSVKGSSTATLPIASKSVNTNFTYEKSISTGPIQRKQLGKLLLRNL